jgi:hypothetical protein
LARSLALASAGNNNAARMAMMAITTSNSIKVKARRRAFTPRVNTTNLGSIVFITVAKSFYQYAMR